MSSGGKSGAASVPAAASAEAPKVYLQEQQMSESAQNARDLQDKQIALALGQEGSINTSPFGSQQAAQDYAKNQGKTIFG